MQQHGLELDQFVVDYYYPCCVVEVLGDHHNVVVLVRADGVNGTAGLMAAVIPPPAPRWADGVSSYCYEPSDMLADITSE